MNDFSGCLPGVDRRRGWDEPFYLRIFPEITLDTVIVVSLQSSQSSIMSGNYRPFYVEF